MHWMHRGFIALNRSLLPIALLIAWDFGAGSACADLIRPVPARGYPEIAGDVSGSQTYSFDPVTKTGTFEVVNFPHVLELGPKHHDAIPIRPNPDGTLQQSLRIALDEKGRLLDRPGNTFRLHGTVVINGKTLDGLLLEGRPTSFGARVQTSTAHQTRMEAFDLNMKITGGELRDTFGAEAYLRIVPQADSTFRGEFTSDFSSDKPLTDLRANGQKPRLPVAVPEPATLLVFVFGLLAVAVGRHLRGTLCRA